MGIFARLARLIKSNINALISSAEDPEKMLNQLVRDMTEQYSEAKRQVASAIADEKRLARKIETEAEHATQWEKKAMLAVRAGDDGLAKEALLRRKEHDEHAAQYRKQWQQQKAAVDQLRLALKALNNKIEEAKRKKALLIARQKRAEAQRQIHDTMAGLKNASAFSAFEEMEERVNQLEAQAEASEELAGEFTGDTLDAKFRELEVGGGAEDELLALKRKMGLVAEAPVKAELPAAIAGPKVRVEEEFDDLDPQEQAELAKALEDFEARGDALPRVEESK